MLCFFVQDPLTHAHTYAFHAFGTKKLIKYIKIKQEIERKIGSHFSVMQNVVEINYYIFLSHYGMEAYVKRKV